ncbi:hypothetical protein D6D54_06370 [Spiroplasma poulsonii]|uniref:Transmembrane protein n=2 Tax=Spiroplasma TaxID=2132 RepID=A0A433EPP8_9MOLU|nr:hypothetical protein [Spiroplasma poulsonii]RUP76367.1 hypothetical protein D6D54_06370 [Spiroplasma poulsonii]
MKTNFKKYFQTFFNIYSILFILYFGISFFLTRFIRHYTNWAFITVTLNLIYIILITGSFLFFLAILIQVLQNFKHYKRIILQWDNILKINIIVILLWITNILLLSYKVYVNTSATVLVNRFTQFYYQFYQSILISFYFFYALFVITFFVTLITFQIYLIYWYKINDLIYFNPLINLTLFFIILRSYTFVKYRINDLIIFLLKKLILISFLIANIIKSYRLLLFKKETTPPQMLEFKMIL